MKTELDAALVRDFPLLFGDRHADKRKTCMSWGFECGDGWEPMLRELAGKLEPIIAALPEAERADYRASQVKEKFGTLRFYMTMATEPMWTAIDQAESKSGAICESCGQPGKLRGGGWLTVKCDGCHGGTDAFDPSEMP